MYKAKDYIPASLRIITLHQWTCQLKANKEARQIEQDPSA
jgi:hypothetical protein